MRALIVGALASILAGSGAALAAPDNLDYGANASLFLAYSFGAPERPDNANALRYGLRLDHDRRGAWGQHDNPIALAEWQFGAGGFEHFSIAGVPLVSQALILNQDDAAADEGGLFDFLGENINKVILAAVGAVVLYGVVEGASDSDSRDADDQPFPRDEINCGENAPNRDDEFCNRDDTPAQPPL